MRIKRKVKTFKAIRRAVQHKRRFVVSVYKVSRHYGGPEEGGWWYDWYKHVESSRPLRMARAPQMLDKLSKKYEQHKPKYDRSSVLGGADVEVFIERFGGETRSTQVPHYE